MAFSVSTSRSRSQESPMLWLSVLAGSLALHLVLLLVGRWYFSQTVGNGSVGSQVPLDFVEIDPNAPALKRPIAPAQTASNSPPTSAAPEVPAPQQPQQASIQSLARQATVERSPTQASSKPETATKQPTTKPDVRSPSGNLPANSQPATRTPATPIPNSTDSTRSSSSPNSGANSTQTASDSSPAQNSPGMDPSTPNSSGSANSQSGNPTTPSSSSTDSNSSQPVTSGTALSGNGFFGGQLSNIQIDPNAKQDDGALSVTFKTTEIPPLELPIAAPKQVLDLRVAVVIENATGVVLEVRVLDSSPTLQTSPNLKEDAQTIAYNLLVNSGELFKVTTKSPTNPAVATPRIITLRIDGRSVQAVP